MGLLVLLGTAALLIGVLGTAGLVWRLLRPPRKTLARALARGDPAEPADLYLIATEHQLSLADGSSTPAWMIDGRCATGPTLVVIHGFGDSRYGALTWTPWLLPRASRLVLFDLRGHGESEAASSHLGTTEARDVLAILDQLDTPENHAAGIVLFGYSMGAGIAIAAAAASDRICGVIADGPYRNWHEPVRNMLRQQRCPNEPFLFLAGLVLRLMIRGLDQFDRAALAARLRCPLLVLHGAQDRFCPPESARAIADSAPAGRIVMFENGDHLDLATKDPARYREALDVFFDMIDAGTSADELCRSGTHDADR